MLGQARIRRRGAGKGRSESKSPTKARRTGRTVEKKQTRPVDKQVPHLVKPRHSKKFLFRREKKSPILIFISQIPHIGEIGEISLK